MTITPDILLVVVAGAIWAMLFEWVPGAATWFDKRTPGQKQQIMIGLMALSALLIFGAGCLEIWVSVTCDIAGARDLAGLIIIGIIGNQGVHRGINKIGKRPTVTP